MMFGMTRKQLSLIVLVVQNSTLVLMMRYSRIVQKPGQPMYIASTAVFLAEVLKIIACLAVMYHQQRYWSKFVLVVRQEILGKPKETAKMLIPSSLYALQNNLLYVALSNLEAATFQVTYQMKIMSTAIFSVVLLGRSLTRAKWFALVLLMIGVTLVQSQSMASAPPPSGESGSIEDGSGVTQNPLIGLIAVITSCISSGFAGCYFEKILKTSDTSMWVRNIQLGLSGAVFSLVGMLMYDMQPLRQGGMLQGYDWLTWVVIANQALGGLLVAIVVKYADVILKSFATSISLILSSAISFYFFDFRLSLQFVVGACIVIFATYNYSLPDKVSTTSTATATTKQHS
ncbi:nucleotide-sugar transporter-domain-containing protein [Zychaea mexicana]|uniref:nucleotide-sugar transporter-domain-containing protein n=1 Tax=Zychaea mexicana TaxID=64656 RepID=UPI0022FF24A5|nr:nucleotide-sugar transporter-domain-containing protein [Zychaea mexicana]KAI9484385.1 nucleotide-sugar transporter-domain-containing protein [Zychaea mexicana]